MKIIKKFSGYSGSSVILFEENNSFYVQKKTKNSNEIYNIYKILEKDLDIAKIISVKSNVINMEYINGIEIRQFLNSYNEKKILNLSKYINFYFKIIRKNSFKYDFSNEISDKIKSIGKVINKKKLIFNLEDLLIKIPKVLSKSYIHGDFTFDNMINVNNKFFLIDISPTNLNALEFDYNKLMQDIKSLWFVRNSYNKLDYQIICQKIFENIDMEINRMYNRYINIFMLLRILPYAKNNNKDQIFLYNEINKLWK